jgi:hypothetical protein
LCINSDYHGQDEDGDEGDKSERRREIAWRIISGTIRPSVLMHMAGMAVSSSDWGRKVVAAKLSRRLPGPVSNLAAHFFFVRPKLLCHC